MRRFLLIPAFLFPAAALAYDFSIDHSAKYSDSEYFTLAERAAVSALTSIGAVQGNPDGTFAPLRTLNRAEFVKIAAETKGADTSNFAKTCFPDVRDSDWFSRYVCYGVDRGFLQGYPDGLFHPERNVNYAEASKILVGLFGYALPDPPANERWAWYTQFIRAAEEHGVALPESIDPGTFLNRGQMARLAAAFYAESLGEIDAYRMAERGAVESSSASSDVSSSVSSSGSTVSSSSVSSVSSVQSSSSPSSVATRQRYPAVSRQIYLGSRSLPIADGIIRNDVGGDIRLVTVRFRQQLQAVTDVYVMDNTGRELAKMIRGSADSTDGKYRTWEAVLPEETLRMSANTDTVLAFEVLTKSREAGGAANELIEVTSFSAFVQQDVDGSSKQLLPTSTHYPQSQTVQSMLTAIQNGPTAGDVRVGKKMNVASFQFAGITQESSQLAINALHLTVETQGVTASNWYLMTTDRPDTYSCVKDSLTSLISCEGLIDGSGNIGTGIRTLQVYADVALQSGAQNGSLRVSLGSPGTIGSPGAIEWTDGTGNYRWMDWPGATILHGPVWYPR